MPKTPKTKKTTQIQGKFIGNEKGFGFVSTENGADIFIPPFSAYGALNGDTVMVKLNPQKREADTEHRQTGTITEIITRSPFAGTYFQEKKQGFVKALDSKIPYIFAVPMKTINKLSLTDGHRVMFSIDKRHNPDEKLVSCFITEVIGHIKDPGVDVLTMVRQAGIPYEFSEAAVQETAQIPQEVLPHEAENREDFRDQYIFTIDGDDTKDIDDAISFEKTNDGFTLGVHIADVTHYVKENSPLAADALKRGTSVYLADRVIPMLPHALSSGICSLFPHVDRLTVSCIMQIDSGGNVTSYKITPSIIHSKRQFTYNEVQHILDENPDDPDAKLIKQMDKLRKILYKKREKRGALDFDIPEAKIRVDDNGKVTSVEAYPRNRATSIIEEFMILANETVATHFLNKKSPFVYRTHDAPSAEKMAQLQKLIQNLGVMGKISLPQRITASTVQKLLNAAAKTTAAYAISTAVLHAMPQALYTPDNPTHFGLASTAYCHFTSPIRRYADLQVHRIIKTENTERFREILPAVCSQCSRTERAAEALEREVAELKKAQFMEDKQGRTFEAIVSGITAWGAFVMLPNTIEGLIPTRNLSHHGFKFNKESNLYEVPKRKKGEKSRKTLQHGTAIKVKLVQAEEKKLTFSLIAF